ncbi:MAG: flagellar protein FlgN [Lachnospiraceae bacterium]|nr:flagellar protein FlgN [Lachnospiraceae bacterium]
MDELLETMEEEKAGYDALIALTDDKRESIVHNKLELLEQVTSREEEITSGLKNLENRRLKVLKDMAVVLGHDGEDMTVTHLIALLKEQPKEQAALTKARDELVESAKRMRFMNDQIQILLEQAMEMVDFDLTLFRSLRQAPETANYNGSGYNTGDRLGGGGFDAKQ